MKNNKKVKVSVFVPCYNMGDYIDEAIQSIYAQTYKDYEIIIVDDGSTDPYTLKQLNNISDQHPEIQIFYKENSGLSGAKNYGIERSNGEYIVCLDADDKLAPKYLEKTVKLMDQKKSDNVAFATTWVQEFGLRDNIWRTSGFDIPRLLTTNVVHAGSIFRKDVWKEVGGFKNVGASYEDWEFWLNIVEKGYKWDIAEEVLFFYRIRKNSLLASAQSSHIEIYQTLLQWHPDLFARYSREFAIENAKELREMHEIIRQKNLAIDEYKEYKEEVLDLRQQVFRLRDEINGMRNSRVLGKVIKARDFVGEARKKFVYSPNAAIHKTRVVVAPFIPAPARRYIKRSLKPKVVTKVQSNTVWDSGRPLVGVVIPYYNRSDTIDETLSSLAAQTFQNLEVIIVDDGSTDEDSLKKLKELDVKKKGIRIIKQENQGVAAARNTGIAELKTKYIICLDSDDVLDPTYVEKATIVLETSPDTSFVTTHMQTFGVIDEVYKHVAFDPMEVMRNNMVITAAEFKKQAWEAVGGYKSGIGYEDWEFWVSLSELGFWGKLIPEALFRYRTSMQSRYVDDKDIHWANLKSIKAHHTKYAQRVKKIRAKRRLEKNIVEPGTAFINLNDKKTYTAANSNKGNILIIAPWLTFGGAETLILNFCNEVKDNFNLSIVTGIESEHEWEYKFKEITSNIYHLTNLFEDKALYIEFISNYIKTRNIDAIHIIHTDYVFEMLPELKRRHPKLKVAVTLFNDRATHFEKSLVVKEQIDFFTSDNQSVSKHYQQELKQGADIRVIPNGINSIDIYNPSLFDRNKERTEIGLNDDDLAVFFIGRVSEEKNPDVFLDVAEAVVAENKNIKFFVIGDGPMTPQVKKQVESINNENVQYLGYQSDIARYLSAADIFVLPSSIEGFPLSVLEAMAMRVAVIASDVGAVSEIVESGEDGIVVTPGSATEIEAAINKLSNNRKLLAELKLKARQKVDKKYSNTILGANYNKLYREITE
jgi:glycosyltransferase involved in cell wall biosynthesis